MSRDNCGPGGPVRRRRWAVTGFVALALGVFLAQLPYPFAVVTEHSEGGLATLGDHRAAAAAAFALIAAGALLLGALARPTLASPFFPACLPAVTITARPIGIALLAIAAVLLAALCTLARHAVGPAWYPPLLASVLGLATAGLWACDTGSPPTSPKTAALGRSDLLWIGFLAATVGWTATRRIGHWYYSWIGDEVSFFEKARDLLSGPPADIFNLSFAHSKHPEADSLYQSLFLRMFGENVTGWRLAEVAVAVVAAALAYLIVVRVTASPGEGGGTSGRLPGVVAGLVVGCSAYTLAFCHIGYNNLHTLVPPLLIVLWLTVIASRPSATRLFILGCLTGLCLYTFLATTIFWLVLAVFFAPGLLSPGPRGRFTAAAVVIGGLVCTTLPILTANQTPLIENLRASHALGFGADRSWVAGWAGSAGVFWHNSRWFDHHVAASLLDPFAGALAAIGGGAAVFAFRRSPLDRFLLLWFVLGTLAVAVTNPLTSPSLTRLLFVLPAAALLAARGATVLADIFEVRLELSPRTVTAAMLSTVALIVVANWRQFSTVVPLRLPPAPFTSTVRALQEHPGSPVVEIAYQIDPNRLVALGPYPVLAARHSWTTPTRLASDADRLDPATVLLVFYSRRLADTVDEIVSPRWTGSCYCESEGQCVVWIFEPTARRDGDNLPGSLNPVQ